MGSPGKATARLRLACNAASAKAARIWFAAPRVRLAGSSGPESQGTRSCRTGREPPDPGILNALADRLPAEAAFQNATAKARFSFTSLISSPGLTHHHPALFRGVMPVSYGDAFTTALALTLSLWEWEFLFWPG